MKFLSALFICFAIVMSSSCVSSSIASASAKEEKRVVLEKSPERDFVILNLSDPQMGTAEWKCGAQNRKILMRTLEELVARVQPDLITITGDLAWAGQDEAYECLASYLDTFGIPWAHVWGNHDNQNGAEYIQRLSRKMQRHPYCLFEAGDPSLGCGNYILRIQEGARPVSCVFLMDSHDREQIPGSTDPKEQWWSRLQQNQIEWYKQKASALKQEGFQDSILLLHIPIFAYREAFAQAYAGKLPFNQVTYSQSLSPELWNEGFKSSLGVRHEDVCSYGAEDGVMAALLETDFTKAVVCGHDHVNNFQIEYQGIKLCYSMKLGAGCYWEPTLNGGTVITIGSQGFKEIHHELVNVDDLL